MYPSGRIVKPSDAAPCRNTHVTVLDNRTSGESEGNPLGLAPPLRFCCWFLPCVLVCDFSRDCACGCDSEICTGSWREDVFNLSRLLSRKRE